MSEYRSANQNYLKFKLLLVFNVKFCDMILEQPLRSYLMTPTVKKLCVFIGYKNIMGIVIHFANQRHFTHPC